MPLCWQGLPSGKSCDDFSMRSVSSAVDDGRETTMCLGVHAKQRVANNPFMITLAAQYSMGERSEISLGYQSLPVHMRIDGIYACAMTL